ncbi:MAG: hypothetical protein L6276_03035 [Acetobacterium sp.]|nr:hypothetical protein [Bacillota bacterium]MCG2729245.1 hypothetical protein [Acetobacterium sp.]
MSKKLWIVDLGINLTKIVVGFAEDSGRVHIEDIRIEKTPGNYCENTQTMGAFLRPLLKGYRRKDELMLLINHKEVLVGTFTFPMMTLQDVEDAIYWKMQLLVSGNINNWRIDFTARERTQRLEYLGIDDKKLDVLGVGVEKARLRWYYRIFKKSGFVLKSIVPQFYAYTSLMNADDDHPTLIIDMGKTGARIFYYNQGSLIENHHIELDPGWDGETYLLQIIKVVGEVRQSPLGYAKGYENEAIYIMGGESLHAGVWDYLSRSIEKSVLPTYFLLDEREELIFPRLMTRAELCLITPGVCGLIKWAQINSSGERQ